MVIVREQRYLDAEWRSGALAYPLSKSMKEVVKLINRSTGTTSENQYQ
jgi:hypothetical protein